MKILVLLNGYNLRRHPRDLPARLASVVAGAGHTGRVRISRSMEHMLDLFGKGVDAGAEAILVGGGDGTLHHAVNHPAAHRVALGMVPLGTINAFLRPARMKYGDPADALRGILRGGVVEGRCGRMNERRFACFASWGYDARVVHRNSAKLKRVFRATSYGLTGVAEMARWRSGQTKGSLRIDDREPVPATSVVVSKIDNYAGLRAFRRSLDDATFDVLAARSDDPATLLGFWAGFAAKALADRDVALFGTRRAEGVERIRWTAPKDTYVQIDGEDLVLADSASFDIRIDDHMQRYLWPA